MLKTAQSVETWSNDLAIVHYEYFHIKFLEYPAWSSYIQKIYNLSQSTPVLQYLDTPLQCEISTSQIVSLVVCSLLNYSKNRMKLGKQYHQSSAGAVSITFIPADHAGSTAGWSIRLLYVLCICLCLYASTLITIYTSCRDHAAWLR